MTFIKIKLSITSREKKSVFRVLLKIASFYIVNQHFKIQFSHSELARAFFYKIQFHICWKKVHKSIIIHSENITKTETRQKTTQTKKKNLYQLPAFKKILTEDK